MTPSMIEAIEAFKCTYQQAIKNHPEDILSVDQMDEQIHQVRAAIGAFSMGATIDEAVGLALAYDRECSCGDTFKLHHRPGLKVHSMQGEFDARGVSYRCDGCGRTVRVVHAARPKDLVSRV